MAAADELASHLDEQQYDLGDGPCLPALGSGEVITAPDLVTGSRSEHYPSTVMSHGILACTPCR